MYLAQLVITTTSFIENILAKEAISVAISVQYKRHQYYNILQ